MPVSLTAIHIYPVKGCRGTSPDAALAQARGFAGDRRWMIVDADGRFISQRSRPPLALITPDLRPGCLELAAPGRPPLLVPLDDEGGPRTTAAAACDVVVWDDTVAAVDAGGGQRGDQRRRSLIGARVATGSQRPPADPSRRRPSTLRCGDRRARV